MSIARSVSKLFSFKLLLFLLLILMLPLALYTLSQRTETTPKASQTNLLVNGDFSGEAVSVAFEGVVDSSARPVSAAIAQLPALPAEDVAVISTPVPTLTPTTAQVPTNTPTIRVLPPTSVPTNIPTNVPTTASLPVITTAPTVGVAPFGTPTMVPNPNTTPVDNPPLRKDGLYTIRERFGYGFARCGLNSQCAPTLEYFDNYQTLNAGWYFDWGYAFQTTANHIDFGGPRPQYDMDYVSLVSAGKNAGSAGDLSDPNSQCSRVLEAVRRNPALNPDGAVWTIGNEIGLDDNRTAERYADEFVSWKRCLNRIAEELSSQTGQTVRWRIASGAVIIQPDFDSTTMACVGKNHARSSATFFKTYINLIRERYGEEMLPDLYVHHGYTPCFGRSNGGWKSWYSVDEFKSNIRNQRLIMKEMGLQDKELWIKEFSPLWNINESMQWEKLSQFFDGSMRFLADTKDLNLGMPADNYRLVQRWAWYDFGNAIFADNPALYGHLGLFDRYSRLIRPLGVQYRNLVNEYIEKNRTSSTLKTNLLAWLNAASIQLKHSIQVEAQDSIQTRLFPTIDTYIPRWYRDKVYSNRAEIQFRPVIFQDILQFNDASLSNLGQNYQAKLILHTISTNKTSAKLYVFRYREPLPATLSWAEIVDSKMDSSNQNLTNYLEQLKQSGEPFASADLTDSTKVIELDVTNLLADLSSDEATFMIYGEGDSQAFYSFASSEASDENLRPALEISGSGVVSSQPRPITPTNPPAQATPVVTVAQPTIARPTTPPAQASGNTLGQVGSGWQVDGSLKGDEFFSIVGDGQGHFGQLIASSGSSQIGIKQVFSQPIRGKHQISADVYIAQGDKKSVWLWSSKGGSYTSRSISSVSGQWQTLTFTTWGSVSEVGISLRKPNAIVYVTNVRVTPL